MGFSFFGNNFSLILWNIKLDYLTKIMGNLKFCEHGSIDFLNNFIN